MSLQPIQRQKLTSTVAQELLALIRRDGLSPGQRLPAERTLAEQLGVSRASLRDGLARLEVLGHIEARQGNGLYVREPSVVNLTQPFLGILSRNPQSVRDILEFRQMLEPQVAAAAALRVTEEQLSDLQASLDRQVITAAQGVKLTEEDLHFHHLIAQISGNHVVMQVLETLQHLLRQLRDQILVGDRPQETLDQHRAIVRALEARNPEAARAAMQTHLSTVADHAQSTLAPH